MPTRSSHRAGFLGLALLAVPAGAANLLTNGDFASGIGGWTISGGGTAAFAPIDAAGNPLSGSLSMRVVTTSALPICESATQCVPVTAGTSYALSGQSLSNQGIFTGGNQARATIGLGYFDAASCTGNLIGGPISVNPVNLLLPNNTWNSGATAFAPAPPSAVSALVALGTCVGSVDGQQTAILPSLFDNIFFGSLPSAVEVPALGTWGMAALGLFLLAVGFRALRAG